MGLVIRKAEKAIIVILGATAPEAKDHIRNGYPRYIPDWESGALTVEEVDDALLPPPDFEPYSAEEQAAIDEARVKTRILDLFLDDRFDLENRVRALEAKAPITRDQFIAALKGRLGL